MEKLSPQKQRKNSTSKVWFVTGSSRGFGRSFVEAALSRGDKVAATARNTRHLDELLAAYGDVVLPLELDVTDKATVFESVTRAKEHFGRLDVIVNNAGYGLFGAIEELTEQQLRDELETNVFGVVWVIQAALPTCASRALGTSSRCPRSPGSSQCRSAAATTSPSGPSKPSMNRSPKRSPASASA